ncbi:hypothetical protein J6X96_04625 [bacterium]|nr:hypothetical protein [bacterium]
MRKLLVCLAVIVAFSVCAEEMEIKTGTEVVVPEMTEEQVKEAERLANIKAIVWDKLYLTMPFADATNAMSGALEFQAPEYPFKAKAYMVAACDYLSGSTNKMILAARRLFFNDKDQLLALEHIFNGCTVDQKNYIMNMYSRKYTMIPIQAKDHSWFKIADGIHVVVEFLESKSQMNIYGWATPSEYTIRAIYYLDKEFIALVNRQGLAMLPPEIAHP